MSGGGSLPFTVLVVAVAIASLFEIIPTFLIKSNVPTIASVKPYRPSSFMDRDLYIEGVLQLSLADGAADARGNRALRRVLKPGEFVYDHPFQWEFTPHRP
ncbi:MAG: cbb3-type cytochrome c oxidase subunit II [Polyangiaceae bacterium]